MQYFHRHVVRPGEILGRGYQCSVLDVSLALGNWRGRAPRMWIDQHGLLVEDLVSSVERQRICMSVFFGRARDGESVRQAHIPVALLPQPFVHPLLPHKLIEPVVRVVVANGEELADVVGNCGQPVRCGWIFAHCGLPAVPRCRCGRAYVGPRPQWPVD